MLIMAKSALFKVLLLIPLKLGQRMNSSSMITFTGFVLARFMEPWAGRSGGSGGENVGMWGSDITGRYITASQVHCQARPGLCATHLCIVLSLTRMNVSGWWRPQFVGSWQTNIEWLVSRFSGLTNRKLKQRFCIGSSPKWMFFCMHACMPATHF